MMKGEGRVKERHHCGPQGIEINGGMQVEQQGSQDGIEKRGEACIRYGVECLAKRARRTFHGSVSVP